MPVRVFQNNFSGGEISPAMASRVDLAKYATGCALIENGIVQPHGGVVKRGGFRNITTLPGDSHLIRFEYSADEMFVLAFSGNSNYRSPSTTLDISTPTPTAVYSGSGALSRTVRYRIRMVDGSGAFSAYSETVSVQVPESIPEGGKVTISWSQVAGCNAALYLDAGDGMGWGMVDSDIEGTSYVDYIVNPSERPGRLDVCNADGLVAALIDTPYTLGQIRAAGFVQSADTLFITHPSHRPRKLVRYADDDWRFEQINFEPGIDKPGTPTLTPSGFSGDNKRNLKYQVSAVSSSGEESYPSPAASISVPKSWTANATVTVSWAAVDGASQYNVYKNERGYYGWIGTIDATNSPSFIDDNISPAAADGPKQKSWTFSASGAAPGVVGIYQQRLVFARSNNERQTIWCSQTGALNNFSTSYPLKDTDAIEVTMDSRQMNEIRHLCLLKNQMVVLTSGAEWLMGPGRNSDGITPTKIHFQNQSFYGSSTVPPLQAGEALLILQNSRRKVRDLYGTYTDEYEGNEVSIMAEHLFSSPIRDWAWQEDPYHTAYLVRDDGVMLCFTYMREQNLAAWSRITTQGRFRSVCCIREGNRDYLYAVVERKAKTIGNSTYSKWRLERMELRRDGDASDDAFYVDGGKIYDRETASAELSTLGILAGEEVSVLADGGEVPGMKVPDGGSTLTLPYPVKKVSVGLPYDFTVRTLDPELNGSGGSTMGLRKNAVKASLRVRETRGVMIGPDEEHLTPAKFPLQEKWSGDDSEPPLFSGDIPIVLQGLHRREASVLIRQSCPFPATILSLNLTVNSED